MLFPGFGLAALLTTFDHIANVLLDWESRGSSSSCIKFFGAPDYLVPRLPTTRKNTFCVKLYLGQREFVIDAPLTMPAGVTTYTDEDAA